MVIPPKMAPARGQYQLLADAQAKSQELKIPNIQYKTFPLTTPTQRPNLAPTYLTPNINSSIGKSLTVSLPKLDFRQARQQHQQQPQPHPVSPLTRSWAPRFEEQQHHSMGGTNVGSAMFEFHDSPHLTTQATTNGLKVTDAVDGSMTRDSDLGWTFAQQGLAQPRHSTSRRKNGSRVEKRREGKLAGNHADQVGGIAGAAMTTARDQQQQSLEQHQEQQAYTNSLIKSGLRLIDVSIRESRASGTPSYDKMSEREMYVEGVARMLQALPPQLDEKEVAKLESFLPPAVVSHLRRPESPWTAFVEKPADATALYRIVYNYVLILFQVVNFFVPFLLAWVSRFVPVDSLKTDLKMGHRNGGGGAGIVSKRTEPGGARMRSSSWPTRGLLGETGRQALVYFLGGLGHGLLDGVGDGLTLIDQKVGQQAGPVAC